MYEIGVFKKVNVKRKKKPTNKYKFVGFFLIKNSLCTHRKFIEYRSSHFHFIWHIHTTALLYFSFVQNENMLNAKRFCLWSICMYSADWHIKVFDAFQVCSCLQFKHPWYLDGNTTPQKLTTTCNTFCRFACDTM